MHGNLKKKLRIKKKDRAHYCKKKNENFSIKIKMSIIGVNHTSTATTKV